MHEMDQKHSVETLLAELCKNIQCLCNRSHSIASSEIQTGISVVDKDAIKTAAANASLEVK